MAGRVGLFAKVFQSIETLLARILWAFFGGTAKPALGGRGLGLEPSLRRMPTKKGTGHMPYVPTGRSAFDPTAHPSLPVLQRRASQALFAFYGQPWVPREYLEMLVKHPEPSAALRAFCSSFGLDAELLRDSDPKALTEFDLLNSHLVEIDYIRENYGEAQAARLIRLRKQTDSGKFDSLLENYRTFRDLERRANDCRSVFDANAYATLIDQFFRAVELSAIDEGLLKRNRMAVEWMERSEIARGDARDDWTAIMEGIAAEHGEGATFQAFESEGATFMEELQEAENPTIYQKIMERWEGRIEEILRLGEKERERSEPERPSKSSLLQILKFGADEDPTYEELKKRYRLLMKENHPDTLPPGSSSQRRKEATDRVAELSGAYQAFKEHYT